MTDELLSTWRDGPARQAILDFVARTCGEDGTAAVPVEAYVPMVELLGADLEPHRAPPAARGYRPV
jgi:hypothetical protein